MQLSGVKVRVSGWKYLWDENSWIAFIDVREFDCEALDELKLSDEVAGFLRAFTFISLVGEACWMEISLFTVWQGKRWF